MKKGITLLLSLSFILMIFQPIQIIEAVEFTEENESEYLAMCTMGNLNEEQTAICGQFQSWLSTQSADKQRAANELNARITEMKKDLTKYLNQLQTINSQISALEEEVATIEVQIEEIEAQIQEKEREIQQKEEEIKVKEEEIEELKEKIRDRMIENQKALHNNSFLSFLMGASDFSKLSRIIKAIEDITNYDDRLITELNNMINRLNEIIEELNKAKEDLAAMKEELRLQKEEVEAKKAELMVKRAEVNAAKTLVEQQEAELEAQLATIAADLDNTKAMMRELADALNNIPSSSGFTVPISGRWYKSAGTWAYASGGTHLGMDFAASVGTPVLAAGNGVILGSYNACPTTGGLGNRCGYPGSAMGGNQIYLVTNINGTTYVIKYCHLQKDSPIAKGTIVTAGDVIAAVGSSGNSSGPHLHFEIFKVGTMSIYDYVESWGGGFDFGAGWSSANRPCSSYSAPCRLRPEDVYGF